jgi:serine/threonine protein kinase
MPTLTIKDEDNYESIFVFNNDKKEFFIGRSSETDISLKDLRASRKHARIFCNGEDYYLEDYSSHNGTFYNGNRIQGQVLLQHNGVIRIGSTLLTYSADQSIIAVNTYFYGYQIKEKITETHQGSLYIAEQGTLKRDVLLWILPLDNFSNMLTENRRQQKLFIEKISCIARFFHRSFPMVLDFATTDKFLYCCFEKFDVSSSLKQYVMQYHPISIDKILNFAIELASGLLYAHQHNILHLHLNDQNVIILHEQLDRVIIRGIGVTNFIDSSTISHDITAYIAPEQIQDSVSNQQNQSIDERADIYSYGCLLYQLITGNEPFKANTNEELINKHLKELPESISNIRKDLPLALKELIEKCLKKKSE